MYTPALRRSSFVLAVRRSVGGRTNRFFVSLSNLYRQRCVIDSHKHLKRTIFAPQSQTVDKEGLVMRSDLPEAGAEHVHPFDSTAMERTRFNTTFPSAHPSLNRLIVKLPHAGRLRCHHVSTGMPAPCRSLAGESLCVCAGTANINHVLVACGPQGGRTLRSL